MCGHDGLYTSKHLIFATRIINRWRASIKFLKAERAEKENYAPCMKARRHTMFIPGSLAINKH